jgi:hypothetical protein
MSSVIGFPMVNAGTLYVNGLRMTRTSTTAISVSAGACRDSTNQDDIVLPAAAACSIASNGIGGLDIGTVAASTFYAVYAVGSSLSANPETNVSQQQYYNPAVNPPFSIAPTPTASVNNNPQPGIMFSLSAVGPVLPLNYDMYRRIGYVLTDGASHILSFWQTGNANARTMWYDATIQVLNAGASAVFLAQALNVAVPNIGETEVIFDSILTPTGAGDTFALRPTGSASANGITIVSGDVAAVAHESPVSTVAYPDGSSHLSVDYKVTGTVTLNVAGYVDNL